jgi:LmeA-like phospholipid-binding
MTARPEGRRPGGGGRRRPDRRLVGIAVGAAVLLGTCLLFWGVDRAARWGAEALLARIVQTATGVPQPPEVEVHGGLVLLQTLRGRYDDVEVRVHGLSSGPLQVDVLDSRLTGVHLPFHDVLLQDPGELFIEHARAQASLTYAELNQYLQATGRPVRLSRGATMAQLTGSVPVLGQQVTASTQASLAPAGGSLAIRPTEVVTGAALDAAGRLLLRQRLTVLVPLDLLPFGSDLRDAAVGSTGIQVRARGSQVVLRP